MAQSDNDAELRKVGTGCTQRIGNERKVSFEFVKYYITVRLFATAREDWLKLAEGRFAMTSTERKLAYIRNSIAVHTWNRARDVVYGSIASFERLAEMSKENATIPHLATK